MGSLAVAHNPLPDALPPSFIQVDQSLSVIGDEDRATLSTDELRQRYLWFTALSRTAQALGARCLAEIDRRHDPHSDVGPDGAPAGWLCQNLRVTDGTPRALIRTARQLDKLPHAQGAFQRGELGSEQVSVICRAVEEAEKTRLDGAWVEHSLVELGRHTNPHALRRHWQ
jgi:hypothetical protein